MKRYFLATTICLALAGTADAVVLNPKGLGQVLIYPYYTVNKGQDTLISLVNVSDLGKVAHVRFHEGYNGRPVLDFLVLLSPHDVWTGAVTAANEGGAQLISRDHSCTLPALPAAGQPFSSRGYTGSDVFNRPDGGPQTIDRTREGHIEIVVDGDIRRDSTTDRLVTHVQNGEAGAGAPANCSQLTTSMLWADLVTPANTLAGSASVVDVGEGTYYAYNADALSDFTQAPLTNQSSVIDYDSLNWANSGNADGSAEATILAAGKPLTLTYARGIDAVSAVFMAETLNNEVLLNTALGAATDWVVTFPTKRFYVDPAYDIAVPLPPFTKKFAAPGEAPSSAGYELYDTEELYVSEPCGPLCGTRPPRLPMTLPYEVNVVGFLHDPSDAQSASGVFGSRLVKNLAATYPDWQSGWARLDFSADEQQALAGGKQGSRQITLYGLPVTGFMAYNIINSNAQPGKLANYGGAFAHRSNASCSRGTPNPGDDCS